MIKENKYICIYYYIYIYIYIYVWEKERKICLYVIKNDKRILGPFFVERITRLDDWFDYDNKSKSCTRWPIVPSYHTRPKKYINIIKLGSRVSKNGDDFSRWRSKVVNRDGQKLE